MATLGPSSKSMRGRTNCLRWRRRLELLGLVVIASIFSTCVAGDQRPCIWDHYSGATFDLSGLKKTDASYHIYDGDDPCTRIEEESYDYYFNICGDVVGPIPEACSETGSSKGTRGSAIQFDKRTKKCNVIGEYEPKLDEYMWTLFKETDPSKGVSIKQVAPKYICSNGAQRTFTIDVVCANKLDPVVTYAREPEHCQYHAEVLSVHGCPKECPYTSNGLCDSHGHCAYDPTIKAPHCYCNEGHGGADCSRTLAMSSAGSGSHFHVQIGLLVTLLILILAMVGVVGYMVLQVYSYRKDAAGRYSSFAGELSRIGRDGF